MWVTDDAPRAGRMRRESEPARTNEQGRALVLTLFVLRGNVR
jgi:hypothetical protein